MSHDPSVLTPEQLIEAIERLSTRAARSEALLAQYVAQHAAAKQEASGAESCDCLLCAAYHTLSPSGSP